MNIAKKVTPQLKTSMQAMLASLQKTGKIPNVKKKDAAEARKQALAEVFAN